MYVYIYIYTYIHTYTYTHYILYTHIQVHTYMYTCVYIYIYIYVFVQSSVVEAQLRQLQRVPCLRCLFDVLLLLQYAPRCLVHIQRSPRLCNVNGKVKRRAQRTAHAMSSVKGVRQTLTEPNGVHLTGGRVFKPLYLQGYVYVDIDI